MKSKLTAFVIGGIVLFSINYYFTTLDFFKDARVKYDKSYSAFLNENVVGVIKEVDYCDHAISIELIDGRFYLCTTYTNSNGYHFMDLANRGDSIIKINGSNYFELKKKNGEKYAFDFIDRTLKNDFIKGSIIKSVSRLKLGVKILNLNTWKERQEVERKRQHLLTMPILKKRQSKN